MVRDHLAVPQVSRGREKDTGQVKINDWKQGESFAKNVGPRAP